MPVAREPDIKAVIFFTEETASEVIKAWDKERERLELPKSSFVVEQKGQWRIYRMDFTSYEHEADFLKFLKSYFDASTYSIVDWHMYQRGLPPLKDI